MTEPKKSAAIQSQDYWDIVGAQLKKRRSFGIALTLLTLMYATAIYAPLLANDRPIYLKAVDEAGYKKALREMRLGATGLAEKVAAGDQAGVSAEVGAMELRISTMLKYLRGDDRALPEQAREQVRGAAARMREGDTAGAQAIARELADKVDKKARELQPAPLGGTPIPGQTVQLHPSVSWPALENLSKLDVYFMVLWAIVMLYPVWNRLVNGMLLGGDRMRIRRSRRRKLLAVVALPALAALVWTGERSDFFLSTYKIGLTNGTLHAELAVFPPVSFGIAESHDSEYFRPPTWHPHSEISEAGYYVNGPRAGRFDPTTRIPRPANPTEVRFAEPEGNHPLRHALGTDSLGRDLLSRLIWGGRVSLAVGLVSTVLLVTIGVIIGSLAGYYGGWVDIVLSRLIEIVQTFPVFFLILILVAFVGPSVINIMLVLGLVRWTGVARLVRGEFIRLRQQDFVVASEALGVRNMRTIFRHVLPNAMSPVLVAATFSVAAGILIESGLSFLGFGIQLPIPSWGSLFIESRSAEHWWIQIFPGLLIFLTVLLYNLVGEGVRDALDPRLKGAG